MIPFILTSQIPASFTPESEKFAAAYHRGFEKRGATIGISIGHDRAFGKSGSNKNAFADKFGDSGSYENTFRDFSANHNSGCKPFSDGFGNTSVSCPCGNTFQDFSANDKSFAGELGDSGKL